jgi:hypothetical protein
LQWLLGLPVVVWILTPIVLTVLVVIIVRGDIIKPPVPPAAGQVRIDANPWGEVEWIRGSDGREVNLGGGRTTPFLTSLPAGDYEVQVSFPHTHASKRCGLQVRPDHLATCWLDLAPVDAGAYFKRIGW